MNITQQYFQVYYYEPVKTMTPKGGQIVCLTRTPDFGAAHIMLVTDGVQTIEELYLDWRDNRLTTDDVRTAIAAEQQNRISADAALQHQITALQQSANRALVFDDHAALEAWMAGGQPLPAPSPPYLPADLRAGWLALFRSEGEADLWWDGSRWLEQEIRLDLSGYRTAAEQDEVDAGHAPLLSPVFQGVPEVPMPDYTNPRQAVPVSELAWLISNVRDILSGVRRCYRLCEIDRPVEKARQYEKGLSLRVIENGIIPLDKTCCKCE